MTMRAKPTRLEVRHAQSVAFPASSAYLDMAADVWVGGQFTVCGWARVDAHSGQDFQAIFSIENTQAPWLGYEEPFTEIFVYDGASSAYFPTLLVRGLPLWLAMTNDGTTLRAYARKDGQRQMVAASPDLAGSGTTFSSIRFGNDGIAEHMAGRLWNCRVWRQALTRAELLRESLSPHPVRTRDLHGWYPMEGRRFQEDRSGLGHHLTIGGAPRLAKPFLGPVYVEPERIWAEPVGGGGGGGDPNAAKRGYFFG